MRAEGGSAAQEAERGAQVASPPEPIIPPPGFEVVWEDPGDEKLFWTMDRMHSPDPVSPLAHTCLGPTFTPGLETANAFYGLPTSRRRSLRINTYVYGWAAPPSLPPADMEAAFVAAKQRLDAVKTRLWEFWEQEVLSEVKELLDRFDAFDLRGSSNDELLRHLDDAVAWMTRLWELHFRTVYPAYVAVAELEEFYSDLFGTDDAFGAHRMVQGLGNMTVETGRALWRLSREAMGSPEVLDAIAEGSSEDVLGRLGETEAGARFASLLDEYVQEFGQRGDKFEIDAVYWTEDPAPVIQGLRNYVALPGECDPSAELERLSRDRERAIEQTRSRLRTYPAAVREQFEESLKAAHAGVVITEDHNFWIDCRGTWRLRRLLLEFGRRLAERGLIDGPRDVFLLERDEMTAAVGRLPEGEDLRGLVRTRLEEMNRYARIRPPSALGTPETQPRSRDNFMARTFGRFFGADVEQGDDGAVRGHPGSPGTAKGTARVINSIEEAGRLKPGDVLVATTTAAPWTPLFATVSAVVTDTGGALSHCAVVAREYGIPAVVGTGTATTVIRDGQIVEVDGDAGVVRVSG
ncbi:MAG TPA: PEP-utilizing enzyme [Actinomycetota bacterium]|nr:PEP-utilizing enzyme [Actinomycetota bacterium]